MQTGQRLKPKAPQSCIIFNWKAYGSALYNGRAFICGPTCRGCADGFICGGGGVANTTEGGCPGGNEGCNKKEVMSRAESEGGVHIDTSYLWWKGPFFKTFFKCECHSGLTINQSKLIFWSGMWCKWPSPAETILHQTAVICFWLYA